MSRMNGLSLVLDEMIECGERMIKAAESLKEIFSEASAPEEPVKQTPTDTSDEIQAETLAAVPSETLATVPAETLAAPAEKKYTFEDIRGAFAQKSHEGHTEKVRALIVKFGANKLSEIEKESYPALMKELEAIG